jgi:DNA polymerase V
VDCNNFYVSCERVFRPDWQHRPLGVLSNNDGCIVARSEELKQAGIPMGAPYFQYKERLDKMEAMILSSNYTLYADMSARVMHTLEHFTPHMEIYSIDEAWLDLSGFDPATIDAYGRMIVETARNHTGIPVSLGMAPTKVLAKVANRICKKHRLLGGVFRLDNAEALETVLDQTKVGDVWGIGQRWAHSLNHAGIYTARQLRDASPEQIRKRYNVVMQRIVLELRGMPCLLEEDLTPKKQIIASRSFGKRVTDLASLQEAITLHASRAAEKLRNQGSACHLIQVQLRTGRHNPHEPYLADSINLTFPVATSDTRKLARAARGGIEQLYRPGYRFAKAGVMLCDIIPAEMAQANLFAKSDSKKDSCLMETMDHINRRFGRNALYLASQNHDQPWAMKRDRQTPAYTTHWSDIPVAH